MKSFSVASGSTAFRAVDGVLFSADGKTLVAYPSGRESGEYRVPNGTETIAERAFASCKTLKTLGLPASLKTVDEGAFAFVPRWNRSLFRRRRAERRSASPRSKVAGR